MEKIDQPLERILENARKLIREREERARKRSIVQRSKGHKAYRPKAKSAKQFSML